MFNKNDWKAPAWLYKVLGKKFDGLETKLDETRDFIENLFKTSAGADFSSGDLLSGKKAFNGTTLITGTMEDKSDVTVTASAVSQDDDYTYLTIPSTGKYSTSSKVKTLNSNLFEIVDFTATMFDYSGTVSTVNITKTGKYKILLIIGEYGGIGTLTLSKNGSNIFTTDQSNLIAKTGTIDLDLVAGDVIKCTIARSKGGTGRATASCIVLKV